jgi:Pyruvate/2-oxoacid:ferredoxin oxidoreductase delta subunit
LPAEPVVAEIAARALFQSAQWTAPAAAVAEACESRCAQCFPFCQSALDEFRVKAEQYLSGAFPGHACLLPAAQCSPACLWMQDAFPMLV